MRRSHHGFTLLEMLVVVALFSMLAAMALPSMQPMFQRRTMSQATQQVEQAIRNAQQTAITHSRTTYLRFNVNTDTYTFAIADPCKPDIKGSPAEDSPTSDRIALVATGTLPAQVRIASATNFNDEVCPAPSDANDLDANTIIPDTISFDFQGRVRNANAGRFVRLSHTTGTGSNFDIYALTQLGDVGTATGGN